MRWALLCGCGRHLDAWDEEELSSEVLTHLGREHPLIDQQEEEEHRFASASRRTPTVTSTWRRGLR